MTFFTIPTLTVILCISGSLFLVIVEVDVELFDGLKWPARSSLLKCLLESKDSVLTSFFSVNVFCCCFITKIVGFLYFFCTFLPKHLRFLNVKTTRLFFQTFTLTRFLQINLALHMHIALLDISMTCFPFLYFNKLQRS